MIRRYLAGLFMALVFSGAAHSQQYQYTTQICGGVTFDAWKATKPAYTSPESAGVVVSAEGFRVQGGALYCFIDAVNKHGSSVNSATMASCPSVPVGEVSWDLVAAEERCRRPITCSVGQQKTDTWISGWGPLGAAQANIDNPWPPLVCDGGCVYERTGMVPDSCTGTDDQANGRQEFSCDVELESNGSPCSGSEPSGPPTEPDGDPTGPGDGDGDGDGDGGDDPGDGDGDGDGGGTGDGDGDGDGSGDGGGSGTGGGTGGNGEGEGEDEGGACGIDGKPACKVKIDESGMPSDATRQAQQAAARAAALGAVDTGAEDVSDVLGDGFPEVEDVPWLWNVSLPAGACSPISFNTRAITTSYDVCSHPLMAAWREAWAYLIGVLGAIYIWRRTTASVGSA